MMKKGYYFTLKTFFFLRFLNFQLEFFAHAEKQLDKKAKVNFKNYDVANWENNNFKTYTAQYLK